MAPLNPVRVQQPLVGIDGQGGFLLPTFMTVMVRRVE